MGTDCMILGSWAEPPPNSTTILDVGTGTGALALMMAQKTQQHHSFIHAIDIDHDSYLQASENFQQSPWARRLLVAHSSFQNWVRSCSTKYDMIISNPPYFLRSNKPEASARAAARHADVLLPYNDLASGAAQLLQPTGKLCLILPVTEAQQFTAVAQQQGLQLTRLMHVFTRNHDISPKRHIMQFELKPAGTVLANSSAFLSSSARVSSSPVDLGSIERLAADPGSILEERLVVMEQRTDPVTCKAVHSFGRQYQQLTQDFHHPSMFQRRLE